MRLWKLRALPHALALSLLLRMTSLLFSLNTWVRENAPVRFWGNGTTGIESELLERGWVHRTAGTLYVHPLVRETFELYRKNRMSLTLVEFFEKMLGSPP